MNNSKQKYEFTLYVTEKNAGTDAALYLLEQVLDKYLKNYSLNVVDITKNPEIAEAKKILATPLLVKELPLPVKRVLADLSDEKKILVGLDVARPRKQI